MSAKFIAFALSFLLPLLTVRYLTLDELGVYRQVFLVVTSCVAILPLGFSMSAFYFLNRGGENREKTVGNILIFNFLSGGIACAVLYFYPDLLGRIFQNEAMTRFAPSIGLIIWLGIFSAFLEFVALANQEARLAAAFVIAAQFLKTVLMGGAIIVFATVEAFVIAAIVQGALQTIILLFYLRSRFPGFWKSFDARFFREQMVYALPFGLAGALYTVQYDLHNYFVGYRFTPSEYAIYAYGCFELPLIGMLYESFSAVMIPRMAALQAQGKKREMLISIAGVMQKLAFIYLPLFAFLMIVAEELITTLYTEKFRASVSIFRINLFIFPFYCLMLDPICRAFKEVGKFLLKVRITLIAALFVALTLGIRYLNLEGMILIVVVFAFVERMILLYKSLKILEFRREDLNLLKNVGETALATVVSGTATAVFYWFTKESLLAACRRLAAGALAPFGFGQAADFVGGSLFLFVWLVVFAGLYLTAAGFCGALKAEDRDRLTAAARRAFLFFARRGRKKPEFDADPLAAAEHR